MSCGGLLGSFISGQMFFVRLSEAYLQQALQCEDQHISNKAVVS